MSDKPDAAAASPAAPKAAMSGTAAGTTAGGLLRQARQAQGLHIAALAAAIKVVPRKLELLESDQYDKLTDATFTRALAQAVCRTLKVDAKPVLALLPPPNGHRLEQVSEGLKTPFHERPGRFVPREWASLTSPALWLAVVLVAGAVLIYALPAGWLPAPAKTAPDTGAATGAGAPFAASAPEGQLAGAAIPETVAPLAEPSTPSARSTDIAAPLTAPTAASAAAVAPVAAGVLQVRTTAQSWVGVVDARGNALLGRMVSPGEAIGLDGPLPLKVRIGNASATTLVFKGQPIELAPFTVGNVARLQLN
jgi:cytoskeleton protein RodZ